MLTGEEIENWGVDELEAEAIAAEIEVYMNFIAERGEISGEAIAQSAALIVADLIDDAIKQGMN